MSHEREAVTDKTYMLHKIKRQNEVGRRLSVR